MDTIVEFRCIRRVSQERFHDPASHFPPLAPAGAVRQLQRYYQDAMTSCRPSHRTSLPSLGGTTVASSSSLPRAQDAKPGARGLQVRQPLRPIRRGDDRTCQVPGGTQITVCHVLRLRQDASPSPSRGGRTVPATLKTRTPTLPISKLNSMPFGIAVYASPGRLPYRIARLASGCWLGFPGWDWYPKGSN